MRNLLACVPKGPGEMVAALVRTIFAQTDVEATRTQLGEIVGHIEGRFDKAAGLLSDAEHDVTAYARLPRAHWRKIWSTNPLESSRRSSGGPTSSGCSPTTPR